MELRLYSRISLFTNLRGSAVLSRELSTFLRFFGIFFQDFPQITFNMSDQTKSETAPKKINAVSSRLLQNTAASSARSGSTPTLTRKFGSQKNDRQTPPTHGRPRSGLVRTGSFRNDKTVVSNGRVMTSSTKKSVFNSTSEAENVVPADWDASAIAPPGAAVKGQGMNIFPDIRSLIETIPTTTLNLQKMSIGVFICRFWFFFRLQKLTL